MKAVVFDVGETLISEERLWSAWADRLGVTRFEFSAVLGSLIEKGRPHTEVFEYFSPGFDFAGAMRQDAALGSFDATDLYPDVQKCFIALRERGYALAIAGNQPEAAERVLLEMGLEVDFVASSHRWGVEKPASEFFMRVAEEAGLPAEEIAYVGDRIDNDVLPARDAGMFSVFLRRGPWGWIQSTKGPARWAHLHIVSLEELPEALDGAGSVPRR